MDKNVFKNLSSVLLATNTLVDLSCSCLQCIDVIGWVTWRASNQ